MEKIVALCKRRGFVFPSSEIYGGFSATYDYGPMGVLLKNNIKNSWWNILVQEHENVIGLDAAVMSHPKTWEASGHVASFTDPLVEDKVTHERFRADHVIEEYVEKRNLSLTQVIQKYVSDKAQLSELAIEEMSMIIKGEKITSKNGNELTEPKVFNLLVEAKIGSTEENKQVVYLRGETCQAIFLQYPNILSSTRVKIPFGVAQIGKAFRNEITTKQFVLRTREFEQMEFEYFVDPDTSFEAYDYWEKFFTQSFLIEKLGLSKDDIRLREIPPAERSHYAKKQKDFEIRIQGDKWIECSPMNHRGDWDLSRHGEYSGHDFTYTDGSGKKYIPNVIETSFGLDRLLYILLEKNYKEEEINGENRVYLSLPFNIAPIKVAVFPLLRNKPELIQKSQELYKNLKHLCMCTYDDNGNIGKRYRRQDEIGTPFCITIDFKTLEDDTVTIRHRDTTKQERININQLQSYLISQGIGN
ncbi:MAG: glycine--tRNA ligase [Candidatus Roizmanbacteria bacterium]